MEEYRLVGGLVVGLAAGVVASSLFWRFYGRVGGKPTPSTWYGTIRAFIPAVGLGFLLVWECTKPSPPTISALTILPNPVRQGDSVIVRAKVESKKHVVKLVTFECQPENVRSTEGYHRDTNGKDGWSWEFDTSKCEPGTHVISAIPETDQYKYDGISAKLRVTKRH